MNTARVIAAKRKLAKSLRAQARRLEDETYLPWLAPARRRAKVILLRTTASAEMRDAAVMELHLRGKTKRFGDSRVEAFAHEL
jgi:23S rRNA A2030 N6-methylase RlmJ